MYLTLTEHHRGLSTGPGNHVVYELASNRALFGEVSTDEHSLLFSLGRQPDKSALLSQMITVAAGQEVLMRCDRIDFPPGGIAHLHTHPGPGIRCQLFGRLTVTTSGHTRTYGRLEPWFESGPDPVLAVADEDVASAFVRVLVLPLRWAGKRTINYVDPVDAEKPKLQKATVFLEERVVA